MFCIWITKFKGQKLKNNLINCKMHIVRLTCTHCVKYKFFEELILKQSILFITTVSFCVINMLGRHVFCRGVLSRSMPRFSTRASNENVSPRHWRLLRVSALLERSFACRILHRFSPSYVPCIPLTRRAQGARFFFFLCNMTFALCRAMQTVKIFRLIAKLRVGWTSGANALSLSLRSSLL